MLAEAFPDFATGRALRVPMLNPGYNYARSPDSNRFDVIMKTYEGKRTIDGLLVTVDGKRLDEHYEVKRFTRYGFEWTYEGDSPRQLALAILFDYLGERDRAVRLSERFMKDIVANLDNDWTISGNQIDAFLHGSDRH